MSNKNPILQWSWEKPAEEGLYLACRGDVETTNNIQPLRAVENPFSYVSHDDNGWPIYTVDELADWHSSFKFAKLCTGSEAEEVSDDR